MRKIKIKIKSEVNKHFYPEIDGMQHALPLYMTKDSAGCDLINNGENIKLYPLDRAVINTGVHIQLPEGYEAQVRGRSGSGSLSCGNAAGAAPCAGLANGASCDTIL